MTADTTTATDGSSAGPGRGADASAVERALAAAVADGTRLGELLDALSRGRLWVPLPDDGHPVTDGSAVTLPTVTYLGRDFIPAFTSARQLRQSLEPRPAPLAGPPSAAAAPAGPDPGPGTGGGTEDQGEPDVPHLVVPAAELARRLPGSLGIALNPGARQSVPVYPDGVAYVASARPAGQAGQAGRVDVGYPPPGVVPPALLAAIAARLSQLPAAREAATAWLSVEFAGEGLVIAVTLDDPSDGTAIDAVIAAIEQAAAATPPGPGIPVDVTFPGEGEPDAVDTWISAHATPFYSAGPLAPGPL
jgi:hypothetical protein